jgi:hypothetical protein
LGVKSAEFPSWPRLLDVRTTAAYLSVSESTVRDYVHAGILVPIPLPGSALRQPGGRIVASCRDRRMTKLLFDRLDLDAFVERIKKEA